MTTSSTSFWGMILRIETYPHGADCPKQYPCRINNVAKSAGNTGGVTECGESSQLPFHGRGPLALSGLCNKCVPWL